MTAPGEANNDKSTENTVRHRVEFYGRVQGVFFRATTEQFARGLPVSGWVRNRSDGSVELQVQGAPDAIDRLLGNIQREYAANITDRTTTELPPEPGERGFSVRH